MALLYDVVPDILTQTGKVKNPCEWQAQQPAGLFYLLSKLLSAAARPGKAKNLCGAADELLDPVGRPPARAVSPGPLTHPPPFPRPMPAGPNVDAHSGVLLQYYGITEE